MDLLVDARILAADLWAVVPELTLRFGGIVEEARVRVAIEPLPATPASPLDVTTSGYQ
jgi:hypothetical protein